MLRAIILALAFLTGAHAAIAQDASTKPPAAVPQQEQKLPQPQGRITGTVYCSDTHKPGRGATVVLRSNHQSDHPQEFGVSKSTVVGLDGTYNFDHLAPGNYAVDAVLIGYFSDRYPSNSSSTQAPPKPPDPKSIISIHNAETLTYDVTLTRGASLNGRVLYSDGAPAVTAQIVIEDASAKSSSIPVEVYSSTMFRITDDLGRFRIAGLPPGTYRVAALPHLQAPVFTTSPVLNVRPIEVFSGDTLHRAAARTYEVRAGDNIEGIDITIPNSALHKTGGSVSAPDGTPLNIGVITLTSTDDSAVVYRTGMNRDGTFLFAAIPSGTYKLSTSDVYFGVRDEDDSRDFMPLKKKRAYANGALSVIVEDSDVLDLNLSLPEIPMPPKKPGDDDDDDPN
jgi:uncharacterized protein (DUF2141 family)